jgi:1-acyl-sn-glycerol-3-phosphate acyltransferase
MLYKLAQFFFRIYFLIYHRVSIRGLGELKKFLDSHENKPVILAANHESYLDPPLVGMAFPTQLRFIAWDALFKVPLLSPMIRALGAVPVSQENKNSAASLLRDVIGFIESGRSVLIFPEGQRTPDGNLQPFEGGVALIAFKTQAPVVPLWIEGTFEAYPIFKKFPRPRRVSLTFGKPIPVESFSGGQSEKERRAGLLSALRSAMLEMRDMK